MCLSLFHVFLHSVTLTLSLSSYISATNPGRFAHLLFSYFMSTSGHRVLVDARIDTLDPLVELFSTGPSTASVTSVDITMQWIVHQQLPKLEVPKVDGSPIKWIDSMVKFKDMVHNKLPLSWAQRRSYLIQHLFGEPKLYFKEFTNDYQGYVLTPK